MLIREMMLKDIPQAVEIENQCFSTPWSEKSFEESITREDTLFLVCEESCPAQSGNETNTQLQESDRMSDENAVVQNNPNTIITGYIGMYLSFDEASITNVAVHPFYRKNGYGRQLVSAAKKLAKEKQIERIFLEVRVSNAPAIALYQELGFENLGIRKNFYDHPKEDAYIMSCNAASVTDKREIS